MAATKQRSPKDIATLLATASCALTAGISSNANAGENWDVDSALMVYSESDSRVSAIEPVLELKRKYDSETALTTKIVGDTLTGASPNGATPSDSTQTFSSPSGNGTYDVPPNTTPLDDTFRDTRGAFSINWNAPAGRDWAYSIGSHLSAEHDYQSVGINGSLSRYLNNKNTTLTLGLSASNDTINPEGGVPTGLSTINSAREKSDDSKSLTDALFGVTQVINRRTLMQFNYGVSQSSGYQTDPYKFLSVIDVNTGGNYQIAGENQYLFEKRPDSRLKQTVYWQTKYQLTNNDILDLSYRYMWDDWGVTSHTLETKYRFRFDHQYLEPQLRLYQQSAADFYQRYLTSNNYLSQDYASADYRLGDMTTYTLGLKYGYQFENSSEAYGKIALYHQDSTGNKGFGKLTSQDLYPSMDAIMVTLGYRF
ncbi:DUF3570 domain-containing protein [Marinomonas piezotolerans]|uniref:DUF3570 domain-containing protein n=1 Tax=Marinomonas piezotolerans TaxID=2213058 RepID=UPI001FE8CED4|nr:DUF3570 domain-containing protein [Marinomonas piezotolerans]